MDNENILVLASSSPRRKQLLKEAGYDFETSEPTIDDSEVHMPPGITPIAFAESLAYMKARSVAAGKPGRRILAADTIVAQGDHIAGKPANEEEAIAMLKRVSSAPHSVITGVALISDSDHRLIASEETTVTMKPMSDDDIREYISTGEWKGKAGAYAIQESADRYIEKIEGSP